MFVRKYVLANQRSERRFSRVRNIVRPIRGHEQCFFTAADFTPPVFFRSGRSPHPFIQREGLFQGSCCWNQREFFCTKNDLKIRKVEENRFANFNISVEDLVESLVNQSEHM